MVSPMGPTGWAPDMAPQYLDTTRADSAAGSERDERSELVLRVDQDEQAPETTLCRVSSRICRTCGGPVAGRRRNGFCSDRCRLQQRRADFLQRILPDDPGRAE